MSDASSFERRAQEIEKDWRNRLAQVRAGSATDLLLRSLIGAPVITVKSAAEMIGRSFPQTNGAIDRLVSADILRQVNVGKRNRAFEAPAIIEAFASLDRQLVSPEGEQACPPRSAPAVAFSHWCRDSPRAALHPAAIVRQEAVCRHPRRRLLMTQQEGSARVAVIQPIIDWACAECGGRDDLLRMDDAGPLCMTCADLDHLAFLPAGDTAPTRRATKASSLSAVVVRWSRSRKRCERQGVRVEDHALPAAAQGKGARNGAARPPRTSGLRQS